MYFTLLLYILLLFLYIYYLEHLVIFIMIPFAIQSKKCCTLSKMLSRIFLLTMVSLSITIACLHFDSQFELS